MLSESQKGGSHKIETTVFPINPIVSCNADRNFYRWKFCNVHFDLHICVCYYAVLQSLYSGYFTYTAVTGFYLCICNGLADFIYDFHYI